MYIHIYIHIYIDIYRHTYTYVWVCVDLIEWEVSFGNLLVSFGNETYENKAIFYKKCHILP